MNRFLTKQRGITLLEVLVAMIILGFALLVLLNMAMVALDGNDWSNKTTAATQLMQEKLEQLRTTKDAGMVSGSDTTGGFTRRWTVADAGSHLRKIEVEVEWQDINSKKMLNRMSALVRTDSV